MTVIWFTGLSGSGKTTIAETLKKKLEEKGKTVEILDGDVVRSKLHKHLGFSREDIKENNRLIAELAKKSQLDFVLVPIISPYREDRIMAGKIIGEGFVELFINAPLQKCIDRDVKGMYKKALAGEIKNFIGIAESNPYESPDQPDIEVNTINRTVEENVEEIMTLLFLPFGAMDKTKLAIKASLEAGKAIMEIYNSDFSFGVKGDDSPVTEADTKSNEIINAILAASGHSILSEESKDNKERLNLSKVWIVDPLDGTSHFVKKGKDFSVMIGLVENSIPVVGVIYVPATGELYVAQKGKGAYMFKDKKWSKLQTNNTSDIEKCKAVMSKHHLSEIDKEFIHKLGFDHFAQRGSCGLKIVEVCRGNADIYFSSTDRIKQWDTCAAWIIVHESGGRMTDLQCHELQYNVNDTHHQHGILVTNGFIHDKIIKKLQLFKET